MFNPYREAELCLASLADMKALKEKRCMLSAERVVPSQLDTARTAATAYRCVRDGVVASHQEQRLLLF